VPHEEKAWAVSQTLANGLTNQVPATLLKTHDHFQLFADAASYADVKQIVTLKGETQVEDFRA
jgi:6-phosphogluconolactonase/glucosamine-6-phosphate isomerase/deaminase